MRALVVDGYNVIFQNKDLSSLADKDLMFARTEITRLANLYRKYIGGIDKLKVVFDGQDKYKGLNTCKHQKYSATGQGDTEIVKTMAQFTKGFDVTVVSNDNYIRNSARAYGASIVNVASFFKKIIPKIKKNENKTKKTENILTKSISRNKANQINEQLKKEWGL